MTNQFAVLEPSRCQIPPGAIVTNYGLCGLCGELYLRETCGTDEGFCGRLKCYLFRLRSGRQNFEVGNEHRPSREWSIHDHRGKKQGLPDEGIASWAAERIAAEEHRRIMEVRLAELTKHSRFAKRHRDMGKETLARSERRP